jgi:nondiscriminating glutamyl-tRNA synthetase
MTTVVRFAPSPTGQLTDKAFTIRMKKVQKETGVTGKEFWSPVRLGLTGRLHGPDLPKMAEILGKDKSVDLIKGVIE